MVRCSVSKTAAPPLEEAPDDAGQPVPLFRSVDLRHAHGQQLVARVAEHVAGSLVDLEEASRLVGRQLVDVDCVARVLQQQPVAFLALLQRSLHPRGLGHVFHRGEAADAVALRIAYQRRCHEHREALAVPAHEREGVGLLETPLRAGERLPDGVQLLRRPVRVGRAGADELVAGEAGHGTEGGVHVEVDATGVEDGEAVLQGADQVGGLSSLDAGGPDMVGL